MFNGSIVTFGSTNITFDNIFVIVSGSFIFFTFDDSIVTLGNTNITSDCIFVTFDSSIITLGSTNITSDRNFVTFSSTFFFFLTFDGSIVTWAVPLSRLTVLLHLGPPLKSLFYLLINVHHNSNFKKKIVALTYESVIALRNGGLGQTSIILKKNYQNNCPF